MRVLSVLALLFVGFIFAPPAVSACERLTVCELDKLAAEKNHRWQLPRLTALSYRTMFAESELQLAAFMLCNAPGRMSCLEADDELARRFDSPNCRQFFFVALVDGEGSGGALMQKTFKVVYAKKASDKSIHPLLISTPDDDVTPVDCWLQAIYAMRS